MENRPTVRERFSSRNVIPRVQAMESSPGPLSTPAESPAGRRGFFRALTYGVSALAALILGLPFVGYLFGVRKRPVVWVRLGPVDSFPPDETRLVPFDNPIRQPWDG